MQTDLRASLHVNIGNSPATCPDSLGKLVPQRKCVFAISAFIGSRLALDRSSFELAQLADLASTVKCPTILVQVCGTPRALLVPNHVAAQRISVGPLKRASRASHKTAKLNCVCFDRLRENRSVPPWYLTVNEPNL